MHTVYTHYINYDYFRASLSPGSFSVEAEPTLFVVFSLLADSTSSLQLVPFRLRVTWHPIVGHRAFKLPESFMKSEAISEMEMKTFSLPVLSFKIAIE